MAQGQGCAPCAGVPAIALAPRLPLSCCLAEGPPEDAGGPPGAAASILEHVAQSPEREVLDTLPVPLKSLAVLDDRLELEAPEPQKVEPDVALDLDIESAQEEVQKVGTELSSRLGSAAVSHGWSWAPSGAPAVVRSHTGGSGPSARRRSGSILLFEDLPTLTPTLSNFRLASTIRRLFRNDAMSEAMAASLTHLVTFTGCEELLRGMPLSAVLLRGGTIFKSSAGSRASYSLSRQVLTIDYFLSHNWIVPWWRKSLALMCHFNLGPAIFVTVSSAIFLAVLSLLGLMPIVFDLDREEHIGYIIRLVCAPIFFTALLVSRSFMSLFGIDCTIFLDKTCIHQEDDEAKRRAIEKLGAFLGRSSTMIVIFTDVYLKKLWTVYEMATFLALHPIRNMVVVPPFQTVAFCYAVLCVYIWNIAVLVSRLYSATAITSFVVLTALGYASVLTMRYWCRERAAIWERLSTFTVHDLSCFCEEDRKVVYSNIVALMRAKRVVRMEATAEDALAAFDFLVRQEIPRAFQFAMGPFSFRYRHYFVVGFFADGTKFLDSFGVDDPQPLNILSDFFFHGMWVLAIWPLTMMYLEVLCARRLHLSCWAEFFWILFTLLLLAVPLISLYYITLLGYRNTTAAGLALSGCSFVASILVVLLVRFRCGCCGGLTASLHQEPAGEMRSEVSEVCKSRSEVCKSRSGAGKPRDSYRFGDAVSIGNQQDDSDVPSL